MKLWGVGLIAGVFLMVSGAFCGTIENTPHNGVLLTIHYMVASATGYTTGKESCGRWADGLNCHGYPVKVGRTMATDPSVLPHFKWYYLQGIGWRYAEDVGGAIKGNRVDILFDTVKSARRFGRKKILIMW